MVPVHFTVFDTETTGLDPSKGHRIIEIAAVRVEKGVITDKIFETYVHPERAIPPEVQRINGITDAHVVGAPTIMEVLPKFLEFAKDSVLVAQNAQFDMNFLNAEKEYCWGYIDLPQCFCTMKLSQNLFPHQNRHNLDAIAARFNEVCEGDRHRALPDVILTAKVLLRMIETGHIHSFDEFKTRASLSISASQVRR